MVGIHPRKADNDYAHEQPDGSGEANHPRVRGRVEARDQPCGHSGEDGREDNENPVGAPPDDRLRRLVDWAPRTSSF